MGVASLKVKMLVRGRTRILIQASWFEPSVLCWLLSHRFNHLHLQHPLFGLLSVHIHLYPQLLSRTFPEICLIQESLSCFLSALHILGTGSLQVGFL